MIAAGGGDVTRGDAIDPAPPIGRRHIDVAHFVSCIPNPAPFREFKGDATIPESSDSSSLKVEDGVVRVPDGPGYGVTIDPGFIREAKPVSMI